MCKRLQTCKLTSFVLVDLVAVAVAVAQVAALGVGDLVAGEPGGATAEAGALAWEVSVCGARPRTQL